MLHQQLQSKRWGIGFGSQIQMSGAANSTSWNLGGERNKIHPLCQNSGGDQGNRNGTSDFLDTLLNQRASGRAGGDPAIPPLPHIPMILLQYSEVGNIYCIVATCQTFSLTM